MTRGLLEGLLLCGIDDSGHGVTLLQSYLDRYREMANPPHFRTGDIQTVALLCAQISKRKMSDPRLEQWIEVYATFFFVIVRVSDLSCN